MLPDILHEPDEKQVFYKAVRVKTGGILHITDNSVIALGLKNKGEAVLAVLHEGNRGQDLSFCRYAWETRREPGEAGEVREGQGDQGARGNKEEQEAGELREGQGDQGARGNKEEQEAGELREGQEDQRARGNKEEQEAGGHREGQGDRSIWKGVDELDEIYLDRIYRRQRGLPWEILRTERCLVRETTVADVDEFYRIYQEPSITKYMEPLYEEPARERSYAQDYIEQVYAFYDFGIWTVIAVESGEVIGRAGICYREGFEDPELGFMIAAPWQGRGLAMEVCRAILEYAWAEHGFERVLAFVQPENKVSTHICQKLGMFCEERVGIAGVTYEKYVWLH